MKYTLQFEPASNLYRIIHAKTGERGGLVSSGTNLSHEGDCWIGENARVTGMARVRDNARVRGHARVSGKAIFSGHAAIFEQACVSGSILVSDKAEISGQAILTGHVFVGGDARIHGTARVNGVRNSIRISGDSRLTSGYWCKTPPQYSGTRYHVSQSGPRLITIGCQTHSFRKWLKNGRAFAKSFNFSDREWREYSAIVRLIIKLNGGVK